LPGARRVTKSCQRQVRDIDKQIETLLNRIMEAANATFISTHEQKIGNLNAARPQSRINWHIRPPPRDATGKYLGLEPPRLRYPSKSQARPITQGALWNVAHL